MKTFMLKLIRLQGIFICIFTLFLFAGVHKVSAEEADKLSYLIKVNRACNTITVYQEDNNGEFTVPIRAMACSVGKGSRTITGTFQTKDKYRWKALMGDVWGQYATRIVGGILFHSVYYYEKGNPASLAANEYNKLGMAASHGCIRLTVGDAKWIYDNCSVGTTVIIYDDKKESGPLGKPETIMLPKSAKWDPTDPSDNNPYKDKQPIITGAKDRTVNWGEKLDLLDGVKAKSCVGVDITSQLKVESEVDIYTQGDYDITYYVKDALGRESKMTVTITVSSELSKVEFKGIEDKIVNGGVIVDEAFALEGVNAYNSEVKLDKAYIKVKIEQVSTDEYCITYQFTMNGKLYAEEKETVIVDREAPVISGIKDFQLEEGEIPGVGYLLHGVTASDNISKPENIEINVKVNVSPDGIRTVTYKAVDEAGNCTEKQSIINN
jgi:hypothetical protein